MSEDVEVDFADVVDARVHVFLMSICELNDPLEHLENEPDDLKKQWRYICRKSTFAFVLLYRPVLPINGSILDIQHSLLSIHTEGMYQELGTDHIKKDYMLEQALQSESVIRKDLATFAHNLFTLDQELESSQKAIEEYMSLFIPPNINLSDDKHKLQKETFDGLLVIVCSFILSAYG
jgi:hypothetical protein